jgi:hypothetical protein
MTWLLRSHLRGRKFPQLVVDERQQVLGGLAVAVVHSFEQAGDVGHESRFYRLLAVESRRNKSDPAVPPPQSYQLIDDDRLLDLNHVTPDH